MTNTTRNRKCLKTHPDLQRSFSIIIFGSHFSTKAQPQIDALHKQNVTLFKTSEFWKSCQVRNLAYQWIYFPFNNEFVIECALQSHGTTKNECKNWPNASIKRVFVYVFGLNEEWKAINGFVWCHLSTSSYILTLQYKGGILN